MWKIYQKWKNVSKIWNKKMFQKYEIKKWKKYEIKKMKKNEIKNIKIYYCDFLDL